jgi:signal transduction histidine kinase
LDTKSRNIKYSPGLKAFAGILVWLCIMSVVGSSAFLIYNQRIITSTSYFETGKFKSEFSRLVHNTVEYYVKLKSEEHIKASGENNQASSEEISGPEENTGALEESSGVPVGRAKTSEEVKNDISDKLNRFNHIKSRLSNTVNFAYYIKNSQTGETITNVSGDDAIALLQKQSSYVYFNQGESENDLHIYYKDDIEKMLSGTPYEVSAAVMEPLKQGDIFYDDFVSYSKVKTISTYIIILLIASAILAVAAFTYLVMVAGRREKGGEIELAFPDRIYTDVHTLLVIILAVISAMVMSSIYSDNNFVSTLISASIILTIDVFAGLSYVLSMVRQYKKRQIIKNSLLSKIFKAVKSACTLFFSRKVFKGWIIFLLIGYGVVNGILFSIMLFALGDPNGAVFLISGILLLAFNIVAAYFTAKSLVSLTQIMGAVKEISAGNLDYAFDSTKISASFLGFAQDIQSIQKGLKKAVDEAVKGERMKTELITNVSHDLKTPLTSIVNYVDLLKKEELNNETAVEYVNILEEKSARLKQLIEDLIEASKAYSGNLVVNAEKVDLHELVMQACGEYEEKIRKAGLDFRINTADKEISVLADGRYMWRIVENLISNTLKYSMPNSRVYINIAKNEGYGVLIIKNISALPLDIPPEQLTERFARGDESRTTEGSGLGLSIAQSLANIQGGRFKIEIDGDLFKAIVEIPLWPERREVS